MNSLRSLCVLLAFALLPLSPLEAQERDLSRLFPWRAQIEAPTGLCRLDIDETVMRQTRPNFSDLRVLNEAHEEVAYWVDRARVRWPSDGPPPAVSVIPERMQRRRVAVRRTVEDFGFRLPQIELPDGAQWTMSIQSASRTFVANYELKDEGGRVVASGSLFRLLAPLRERLEVPIPVAPPGTSYRMVVRAEAYVEPSINLLATPMSDRTNSLALPLVLSDRVSVGTETRVKFARPSGVVPTTLDFQTTSSFFSRNVRVYDLREGQAPVQIGEAIIFRAPEVEAEQTTVPLSPATGTELLVVIDDGDSPSLSGLELKATVLQPALFFDCQPGQSLYYGGGRARPPHYDTQAFAGTSLGERVARGATHVATLRAQSPNPDFDDGPALAPLMRPGREIDRTLFRASGPLMIQSAPEGVSRFIANATLIAAAAPDMRDLRVVGSDGRGWPFVRAPQDGTLEVPLNVTREAVEGEDGETTQGETHYRFRSPDGDLPFRALHLESDAAFIQRAYRVSVEPPPNEDEEEDEADNGARLIQGVPGMLSREPGESGPLVVPLPRARGFVDLYVVDGEDAPLDLRAVGVLDAPTFYVIAPEGSYEVVAGAEVPPPGYEVESALPLILATAVQDARLGAIGDNPAYAPPPVPPKFSTQQLVVWIALVFAVLILGFLTWRASRAPVEEAGGSGPIAAPSDKPSGAPQEEAAQHDEKEAEPEEPQPEAEPSDGEPAEAEPAADAPDNTDASAPPTPDSEEE